ncbi:8571_t:CDS:1, partial [Racocetra fulgida]
PEPNYEAGSGSTTQAHRERIQEKMYAPKENFQSIYKTENGIKEKEPLSGDIKFLEKRPDTERQHKSWML